MPTAGKKVVDEFYVHLSAAGEGGLKFEVRHRPTCKVSPKWEPSTRT